MGKIRQATRQIIAGGSAGLVEVCIMHPLDLVKTRLQVSTEYKGLLNCIRSTFANEGFTAFYKGILPPIAAETPKRATKFFTFEVYKKAFVSPNLNPAFTLSLAGLCSGMTEAVVVCPFEVVKIRLQMERKLTLKQQKSAATVAREIILTNGIGRNGLFLGLTSTLARNGTWNMIYFGLYHNVKPYIPDAKGEKGKDLFGRIALGFTAGSLASVANVPFDVAKSRIQGPQPNPGIRKYFGCLQSMNLVYKEEGLTALYNGLLPKVMRLGPGGAIMLIVFESVNEWLSEYL